MTVTINGDSQEIPDELTIAALLDHLGIVPGRVAVEYNLEILPRARWKQTAVQAGDRLEIVHMVGGG